MTTQEIWQAQSLDAPRISLEYVRHLASQLEGRVRRVALLNYAVCAVAYGVFAWGAWHSFATRPLLLAAIIWYGTFAAYFLLRLRRYTAEQALPPDAGVLDTLRFHRQQLERQRDWRRWNWQRGIPAMLVGVGLQVTAMLVYSMPVDAIVRMCLITLGWAVGGGWAVEMRARRSQREIDALDTLAKGG